MIRPELLELLRCPIDPAREALLRDDETHLACQRCEVHFRIREGLPNLVAEEAVLPKNCAQLRDLPCQKSRSA